MSEDTSEGFADQPRAMVLCTGCGFNIEREHVLDWGDENAVVESRTVCERCTRHCTPDVREAYRRGFNAGLDAMAEAVQHTAKESALRMRGDRRMWEPDGADDSPSPEPLRPRTVEESER